MRAATFLFACVASFLVRGVHARTTPDLIPQATVQIRVVDQHGQDIPGSLVEVVSAGSIQCQTGASVSLPTGDHSFYVIPAVGGSSLGAYLFRTASASVGATTTNLTFEWITSQVRLRVHDQNGVDMIGNFVELPGLAFPNGAMVTLPVNDLAVYPTMVDDFRDGYDFVLTPSAFGRNLGFGLARREDNRVVTASTTEIAFEWRTANVRLRVHDQHGVDMVGNFVEVAGGAVSNGGTVALPVNDPGLYPTLFAEFSDGYDFVLTPSAFGRNLGFGLARRENNRVVTASTTEIAFEWRTADVRLRVHDQHGVDMVGNFVEVAGGVVPNGGTVALPVNDPGLYPTLFAEFSDGYDLRFTASSGSLNLGNALVRSSLRHVVKTTTTEIAFEWYVRECALHVVTESGQPVPGSLLVLPGFLGPLSPGGVVRLPSTDNAAYPTLTGTAVNGYAITVRPGDVAPAEATFEFEVQVSGALLPDSFVVAGNTYRLACLVNSAPSADAGPNVAIASTEQGTTSVVGHAADADMNTLSYRWLEGTLVHFGPAFVDAAGLALLPLGSLPPLALGVHELTLEVTDGFAISTARMHLTIGNSRPVATCSGSGTYQAGVDAAVLGGSVADFDGDNVAWSWWKGALQLASGTAFPAAGGMPTTLPTLSLSTGVAAQLGIGTHVLQLRLDDGNAHVVTCDATVSVVDDQAPRLAPVADKAILWPPNHALIPITIVTNAFDAAGGPVMLSASVQSSEDAYKDGAGNTIPDYLEPSIDLLTGRVYLFLRAERSGKGPGRTYTVTITATDGANNSSTAAVVVTAPHDRG